MNEVRPVVLCGGSGTRLWPLSRADFPKQFLPLVHGQTLFQEASERLLALGNDHDRVLPLCVVCNEEHRFLAQEQLRESGIESAMFLLEPVGRNTASALTLAALAACQEVDDSVLVVIPADQTIADSTSFLNSVRLAIEEATRGTIVILGISPDRPETGYGYVKVDRSTGIPLSASLRIATIWLSLNLDLRIETSC